MRSYGSSDLMTLEFLYDCRILSLRALLNLGYAFISCVSGFSIFHTKLLYFDLDSVAMMTQSRILCVVYSVPHPDLIRSVDPDSDPGGQK
jgi:hypothetical protein